MEKLFHVAEEYIKGMKWQDMALLRHYHRNYGSEAVEKRAACIGGRSVCYHLYSVDGKICSGDA